MALNPQFGSVNPFRNTGDIELAIIYSLTLQLDANTFAQQYLPEIYEQEVERYGNRTLSGFLRMVGAEMPMTSDQVIWSEQNRLHISYIWSVVATWWTTSSTITVAAPAVNVISINDTIVVLDPVTGAESKGIVLFWCLCWFSGLAAGVIFSTFDNVNFPAALAAVGVKIFVYGSDYQKGSKYGWRFSAGGAKLEYLLIQY